MQYIYIAKFKHVFIMFIHSVPLEADESHFGKKWSPIKRLTFIATGYYLEMREHIMRIFLHTFF